MEIGSKFDADLLECIDAGLEMLGSSVREVIYNYLAYKEKFTREQIPRDPNGFVRALENALGPAANAIESIISQRIVASFGLDADEDPSLPDIVERARARVSIGQKARIHDNHKLDGSPR